MSHKNGRPPTEFAHTWSNGDADNPLLFTLSQPIYGDKTKRGRNVIAPESLPNEFICAQRAGRRRRGRIQRKHDKRSTSDGEAASLPQLAFICCCPAATCVMLETSFPRLSARRSLSVSLQRNSAFRCSLPLSCFFGLKYLQLNPV